MLYLLDVRGFVSRLHHNFSYSCLITVSQQYIIFISDYKTIVRFRMTCAESSFYCCKEHIQMMHSIFKIMFDMTPCCIKRKLGKHSGHSLRFVLRKVFSIRFPGFKYRRIFLIILVQEFEQYILCSIEIVCVVFVV